MNCNGNGLTNHENGFLKNLNDGKTRIDISTINGNVKKSRWQLFQSIFLFLNLLNILIATLLEVQLSLLRLR